MCFDIGIRWFDMVLFFSVLICQLNMLICFGLVEKSNLVLISEIGFNFCLVIIIFIFCFQFGLYDFGNKKFNNRFGKKIIIVIDFFGS